MADPRRTGLLRRLTGRASAEGAERRLTTLERQGAKHGDLARSQRKRLDAQKSRLDKQAERIKALETREEAATRALQVLQNQLAAMELRMEAFESRLEAAPTATEPERAEARNLLDEVREEHRRIRSRFGVVTSYEERIRRLEQALEPKPGP